MPVKRKKDGFYWGSKGPFKTRRKAEEVGRAAYASGYDELEKRIGTLGERVIRLGTPGRRKALKALAKRKRINKARVAKGEKPLIRDPKTGKMVETTARRIGVYRDKSGTLGHTRRRIR
tara:strand:+ start:369 stop:725 length:357 start_codon:yes stop_codon:yes gene_type:complete